MKKLSLILLMAVMAIPVMQAQLTAPFKAVKAEKPTQCVVDFKALEKYDFTVTHNMMNRATVNYVWDFEDEESFEGWGSLDYDGDGYGWGESSTAYSGNTSLTSISWSSSTGALDPDNWLISPVVPLGGELAFWARNYSSWFADKISVYVCVGEPTTINDFVLVEGDILPPSNGWEEYTFDLRAYAGNTGCFAIRHHDSNNMMWLYVDYITLSAAAPDAPVNVTVEPGVTTADVAWEDPNNAAWNLRYRPVVEGNENNLLWDFEEDTEGNTNTELTGGWTSVDSDGDGYDWYHLYGVSGLKTHSGTGHVTSASYNGNALNPDNWLISPEVKLDGELSFWACGQDPSYAAEVFCVYASTDGQNWEPLTDDITATGEMTQYTFDLTGYEGAQGYVAIRHYNCYDKFRLNVDDIAINYVQEAEWIYAENLDELNYLIENLTPETTYEVQVQGINEDGVVSPWTESVEFTTLAEQVVPTEQTVAPGIQTWTGTYGDHTQYVKIEEGEPNCEIEYRFMYDNGEWSEWMTYEEILTYTQDGIYEVEARAKAPGKEWSETVGVRFVITPRTGLDEVDGEKAVAGVRYFNAIGQEMAQPNGLTIVVTTYTDGTTTAVKVMK